MAKSTASLATDCSRTCGCAFVMIYTSCARPGYCEPGQQRHGPVKDVNSKVADAKEIFAPELKKFPYVPMMAREQPGRPEGARPVNSL